MDLTNSDFVQHSQFQIDIFNESILMNQSQNIQDVKLFGEYSFIHTQNDQLQQFLHTYKNGIVIKDIVLQDTNLMDFYYYHELDVLITSEMRGGLIPFLYIYPFFTKTKSFDQLKSNVTELECGFINFVDIKFQQNFYYALSFPECKTISLDFFADQMAVISQRMYVFSVNVSLQLQYQISCASELTMKNCRCINTNQMLYSLINFGTFATFVSISQNSQFDIDRNQIFIYTQQQLGHLQLVETQNDNTSSNIFHNAATYDMCIIAILGISQQMQVYSFFQLYNNVIQVTLVSDNIIKVVQYDSIELKIEVLTELTFDCIKLIQAHLISGQLYLLLEKFGGIFVDIYLIPVQFKLVIDNKLSYSLSQTQYGSLLTLMHQMSNQFQQYSKYCSWYNELKCNKITSAIENFIQKTSFVRLQSLCIAPNIQDYTVKFDVSMKHLLFFIQLQDGQICRYISICDLQEIHNKLFNYMIEIKPSSDQEFWKLISFSTSYLYSYFYRMAQYYGYNKWLLPLAKEIYNNAIRLDYNDDGNAVLNKLTAPQFKFSLSQNTELTYQDISAFLHKSPSQICQLLAHFQQLDKISIHSFTLSDIPQLGNYYIELSDSRYNFSFNTKIQLLDDLFIKQLFDNKICSIYSGDFISQSGISIQRSIFETITMVMDHFLNYISSYIRISEDFLKSISLIDQLILYRFQNVCCVVLLELANSNFISLNSFQNNINSKILENLFNSIALEIKNYSSDDVQLMALVSLQLLSNLKSGKEKDPFMDLIQIFKTEFNRNENQQVQLVSNYIIKPLFIQENVNLMLNNNLLFFSTNYQQIVIESTVIYLQQLGDSSVIEYDNLLHKLKHCFILFPSYRIYFEMTLVYIQNNIQKFETKYQAILSKLTTLYLPLMIAQNIKDERNFLISFSVDNELLISVFKQMKLTQREQYITLLVLEQVSMSKQILLIIDKSSKVSEYISYLQQYNDNPSKVLFQQLIENYEILTLIQFHEQLSVDQFNTYFDKEYTQLQYFKSVLCKQIHQYE